MTGRPRTPHGGGTGDDGTPPGHRPPGEGGPPPRPHGPRTVAEAQQAVAEKAQWGRVGLERPGAQRPAAGPEEASLREVMRKYELLGEEPPRFSIASNDAAHVTEKAHTITNHGPDVPLLRDPREKRTIEGRIYGDGEWGRPENQSFRWIDHTTMNREINDYVEQNWTEIRSNLALDGQHVGAFNAGHRVGEGFYNKGMYGAGPRQAQYTAASLVRIVIELADGADPPRPFVLTAYPAGILPPGLL